MIHKIKRTYWHKGKEWCDIWDYKVREAIEINEDIRVYFEKKNLYQDYKPKELKKHTVINPDQQPSSFGKPYYLYSYHWSNPKIAKKTQEQEREELKKAGVYI